MTEKEKAAKGYLYDAAGDRELMEARNGCYELCYEYNHIRPPYEQGKDIIRRLFGKTGNEFTVMPPFQCDYGYNIEIGENFFANFNCIIVDCAKVKFGNHVFIAPGCGFYTAGHPLDVSQRNQGLEYAYPITVGDNVWFGGNVSVLPGVTIGSNTVIGAGSVVNFDIPSGVIAAGNPCRVIREITEEDSRRYWKD